MIRWDGVRKSYGDVVALDGFTLEVERGEILGLLGPNGAGKSTAVLLASGVLAPDAGTIDLDGLGSPTRPSARTRLGVAPQALAIYDELTARANAELFATIAGVPPGDVGTRATEALAFVGLADRAGQRVGTFSGGMKRRMNLACAIVHRPALLLLDEPTVGVDPQSRSSIFDGIEALRERGTTILYTTHYMEEAERLCDRVAIVDGGKVLSLDTVGGLIAAHGGDATVIADVAGREQRIVTPAPLDELRRLDAAGTLGRFRVERTTLEQVFLGLTGRKLRDS